MQKIHRQGSVAAGVALIVSGAFFLIIMIVVICLIPKPEPVQTNHYSYDSEYAWLYNYLGVDNITNNSKPKADNGVYFFPIFMLFLIAAVLIIFGVVNLVNGSRGMKVKENGVKSTCEITRLREVWHKCGGRRYEIEFTYKGQSGTMCVLNVSVSIYRVPELEKGMKFECYVYQDDCYIDMDHLTPAKTVDIDDIEF